jgi:hypothetical protein
LAKILGINLGKIIEDNGITTSIVVNGNKQVNKVLDWMYNEATIFMSRKYDKYIGFRDYIQNDTHKFRFSVASEPNGKLTPSNQ